MAERTEIQKMEDDLIMQIDELSKDIEAIQQPRSDFALEHFVVLQHDTPARQRAQAVLELQIKMFNIKRTQLEERRQRVKMNQAEAKRDATSDPNERALAEIDIEEIVTNLAEMRLGRIGNIREAQALLKIVARLPKYTYEGHQKEEAAYWQSRLSRQLTGTMRFTGIPNPGDVDAIRQMLRQLGDKAHALPIEDLQTLASLDLLPPAPLSASQMDPQLPGEEGGQLTDGPKE